MKNSKTTMPVLFSAPKTMIEQLDAVAAAIGQSRASVIRNAIALHLDYIEARRNRLVISGVRRKFLPAR